MTRYWKLCHACSQGNGEVVAGTRAARIQMARLGLWKEVWNFCCLTARWRWERTPSWGKSMKELECRETWETKQWDVRQWIHDPSCKTRQTLQVIYYSSTSSGRAHCKPLAFLKLNRSHRRPRARWKAFVTLGFLWRDFQEFSVI